MGIHISYGQLLEIMALNRQLRVHAEYFFREMGGRERECDDNAVLEVLEDNTCTA